MCLPPVGARLLSTVFGDWHECGEGDVQEPAEPDALSAAVVPDAIHAVVPIAGSHQREPMQADGEASVEGGRAVLEQRDRAWCRFGLEVVVGLVGPQDGPFEVRHHLVEHRRIAGDREIAVDRVRQPYTVIGDASPHATP